MKVKNVFTYFTDTILRRNANSYRNPRVRWAVRQYKLLFYTARGLIAHDTIVRSAALTFYTLISIVPILALVFAVVKGFGLLDGLIDDLYALFPQNVEVLDYMVEFARKALANTQGGLIALVSVVTLFWAVIRVFGSVESAFNNIWEVQSSRNIARQYLNYIVIAMVAPILWLVASTMGGYLLRFFDAGNTFLGILLSKLSALVIIWGSFTLIYAVVPNTKVLWRSAFMAGIVAGTVFMLFQWGYLYLQGWMTSYNAIYGSFAALPLFLLWLQISWEILLFGGELSFAYQNIDRFAEERESLGISNDRRRRIILAVMLQVVHRFRENEGALPVDELRRRLSLPTRIVNDVLHQLVRTGLLIEIRNPDDDREVAFAPGRDIHEMTLYNIFRTIDNYSSTRLYFAATEETRRIDRALDELQTACRTAGDRLRLIERRPQTGFRAAARIETLGKMKNIVLIGSGNLAEALARAISRTEGATLLQIFARNAKRGTALALENGTAWSSDPRELAAADLYILAVSDAAITTLAESLPIPAEAAVVHTAGGIGIEALPARFDRRGVLYPLQTFTQGRSVDFAKIPLFVEGNDDSFTSELEAFARNLSRTVYRADSDRRVRLHLAAVFACNFVNHLYALGGEILHGTELPFDVLKPLIAETAAKAVDSGDPHRVQTGPAVRGDLPTLRRHEAALAHDPRLLRIYESLSQDIWETSKKTS